MRKSLLVFPILSATSFLDVALDLIGDWEFSFADIDVDNTFSTTFGAGLEARAEVGCVPIFGCVAEWETDFGGDIDLFDSPQFGLDFGSVDPTGGFSITVIPEPTTGLLLALGLGGLSMVGRRQG